MKESKLATILALAALDDSEIKSLEQRVNELAELGFKPEIVEELPEEGNDHTLYLVPQNDPGEDPWYKEYLWLDNEWENIGTTSINFDNYELLSNKVTELTDESTDTQYPSAKAVYDMIANIDMDSIPIIDEVKFHEIQEHQYPQWTERQMSTYLIYAECGPGVYQMKLNSGWNLFHSVNNGLKYMSKECLAIIQKRCGIYIWDYADRQATTGEPRITVYYYNGKAEPTTTTYYASLNEDVSLSSLIHLPWFSYDVQNVFYQALHTDPWDSSFAYEKGDLVLHVNIGGYPYHIYEAKHDIVADTAWNPLDWDEILFPEYFPKALNRLIANVYIPYNVLSINTNTSSANIISDLGGQSNINKIMQACDDNTPIFCMQLGSRNDYTQIPITINRTPGCNDAWLFTFSAIVDQEFWTLHLEYLEDTGIWTATEVTHTPISCTYYDMPDVELPNIGAVIQYIGPTTVDYISGYFYKLVEDAQHNRSWEQIDVQPNAQTEVMIVDAEVQNTEPFMEHYLISAEDISRISAKVWANEHFDLFIRFVNSEDISIHPACIEIYDTSSTEVYTISVYTRYDSYTTKAGTYRAYIDRDEESSGVLDLTDAKVDNLSSATDPYNSYPSVGGVINYVATAFNELGYKTLHYTSQELPFRFDLRNIGIYVYDTTTYPYRNFTYKQNATAAEQTLNNIFGIMLIYTKKIDTVRPNETFAYLVYASNSDAETRGNICMAYFYINSNNQISVQTTTYNNSDLRLLTLGEQRFANGLKRFDIFPEISYEQTPSKNLQFVHKKYVDDKIAAINTLKRAVVETLPVTDIDPNTIYMILKTSPELHNVYDEWMYINNEWELIGTTEVDLTNYLAKDNSTAYTPSGQYNPSTKGYVDNYFFKGQEEDWNLLTPQQQAAYAVAVVTYGVYELTTEDTNNLDDILGSEEPIISDITEDEGIDLTNQIIGGNE